MMVDIVARLHNSHPNEGSHDLACRCVDAAIEIERLQARIDSLMFEYCPDEMTPKQIAEWERHQRAVPNS